MKGGNLSWMEFARVDMRVGTVVQADLFPEALRPAYILHIDFGDLLGVLKSSAQITFHYSIEDLIGRQVVAVVNFPPKQIAQLMSSCLVTGFPDENGNIVLTSVERPVPNGSRLF